MDGSERYPVFLFWVGVMSILIVYFCFPMIWFISIAERSGIERAGVEMSAIKAGDVIELKKLDVSYAVIKRNVGGTIVEEQGAQISCTDRFCDFYNPSTETKRTIP